MSTGRRYRLSQMQAYVWICLAGAFLLAAPHVVSAQISWTHQFGTSSDDFAFGIAVDPLGIYSAGYTGNSPVSPCKTNPGSSDSFVRQYDPATNTDTTLASSSFEISRGVTTYAGDVYSAGIDVANGRGFVRKTGGSGWTDYVAATSQLYGVAVNGAGIYSTGFIVAGSDVQAFVQKDSFSGVPQWTDTFGTSGTDLAIAVALDGNSLYVTGYTTGSLAASNAGGTDLFVRKYDVSGPSPVVSWTKQFGTAANDSTFGAAADSTGVYVTGCVDGTPGGGDVCAADADAFVRKLNASDGSSAWFSQFGTAGSFDSGLGVAVNAGGVYVSGYTDGQLMGQTALGLSDAFLRKYTLSGTPLWTNQFGSSAIDLAWGVAVDATNAYVAGCTTGALPGQISHGGSDAYIAKNPPINVAIDIRPGTFPNSINLGSNGVVPVAILSSPSFDATTIDPASVTLAGAAVKLKGNGSYQSNRQDVNGDGLMDLVIQVITDALQLSSGDTTATLQGMTTSGEAIQGTDLVRIVSQ